MQPDKKANQTLKLLFAVGAVRIPLVVPSGSHAADAASGSVAEPAFDPARFEPSSADGAVWSLIVGAGALYAPEYEGSRGFKVSPLPAVIFTYGDWLTLDPRGISVTAFTHQGFSLAGKVGYEMGRDEDDGDRLKGLGDIDFAATIGARATYRWEALELYAEVDQTVGGEREPYRQIRCRIYRARNRPFLRIGGHFRHGCQRGAHAVLFRRDGCAIGGIGFACVQAPGVSETRRLLGIRDIYGNGKLAYAG